MKLPGDAAGVSAINHPLLDAAGKKKLDVLHLEDNDIDALIFKQSAKFCSRPLKVRRAESIADFKKALEKKVPHLICADHVLPDGLALEAIALASEHCPEAPFIVITGAGEEEVAAEYLRAGAADYLPKQRLDLFPQALEEVINRFRDRTLRELAEKEALRLNQELLALVRHVEEERDEEKRSLSRDIHDQLGQELTALKLGLFWIQGKVKHLGESDTTKELNNKLTDLIDMNTDTIKSVRNLAHALRPVVLDQVGLEAGLESLVKDFNLRQGGFCGLHCSALPEISEGMRTDVFRIVQEALTNISRHAESSLAYVRLSTTKGGLLLEIGDNGKGMDMTPSDSEQVQGLGMVGMRERARTHGGKIKVESETMKGTSISVYFSQTTKP